MLEVRKVLPMTNGTCLARTIVKRHMPCWTGAYLRLRLRDLQEMRFIVAKARMAKEASPP